MTLTIKKCISCGEQKPSKDFYLRNKERGYLTSYCKLCLKKNKRKVTGTNKKPDPIAEQKVIDAIKESTTPMSANTIRLKTGMTYYYTRRICMDLLKKKKLYAERKSAHISGAEIIYTIRTSKKNELPKVNQQLITIHNCFNNYKKQA